MGSHAHRRVANWQQRCVLGGRCESWLRHTAWHDLGLLCVCTQRVLHRAQKSCNPSAAKSMSRTGLRLASHASPALAALRLAHEHARAEHARHARTTRARLASCAHALTRQHALTSKSLAAVLKSLATGWPSAGSPLAHLARMRSAMRLPPSLLARHMRRPHVVHAIHHRRCCPRTQRHDDNDRDEDERHDEEDQGHDGRRERVRAARACTAHAQRRTRKHAAREHEPGPRHSTCYSNDRHCARHTTR